jgi:hypothetical protein
MSYRRFEQDDIVVSADSITSPAWSNNAVTLEQFVTSSQAATDSGKYYYHIYNTGSSDQEIQFAIAYGHRLGSGSGLYDASIPGKSYSATVYGQFRTLINGDEDTDFTFDQSGTPTTPDSVHFISIQRSRFKEKILPGSILLSLSGSDGELKLTDNSTTLTTDSFVDAGRVYSLYSGSAAGTVISTTIEYGKLYPDIGLIALNTDKLITDNFMGTVNVTSNYTTVDGKEACLSALQSGSGFSLRADETLSSNFIFVRARNSEFNYSTNPSNITGSGELRHSTMIDNPQSYVTQVGLYNDSNDLLAVAKLSAPLLKDFTKEALVRIKLDY